MAKTPFMTTLNEELAKDDLAESTIKRTLIDARQFEEWYDGTAGHGIDPDDIQIVSVDLQEYRGWLQREELTPGTIRRKFASIRKALMLMDPETALGLRWPKMPTQQRTAPSGFSRTERHAVIRASEQLSVRDEAIIKLLLYTGARASSVAVAKVSNVTIKPRSGQIEYDVAKGNRSYTVPLNNEVRDALGRWIDVRPPAEHDHLFTSERFPHPPISRTVIWRVWHHRMRKHLPQPLADKIEGPHQARHDLARRLLSGDEGNHPASPAADVAAILGHADPRITVSIYSRPSEDDKRRALDRIVGDEKDD